jgi:predicted AlkP superfamily pyrophosphatase or phosphodiesterase
MWWGGEPIWVTLRRAGQLSAPLHWVGSEAPIGGAHARYWKPFDERRPGPELVDQLLRWLDLPAVDRPTFLTLYFNDVDTAGHDYGPESTEVRAAIARVDGYLGRLLTGLQRRGLLDRVNVVVTSDHGMSATSRDRVIYIDDYLTPADGQIVDLNPGLGLVPPPGAEAAVLTRLQHVPHLSVYRRETTPPHWHYRDHPRIPPVVGVADDGWLVMRRKSAIDFWKRHVLGAAGTHGYDPSVASMWTLFVAAGPAFRRGVVVPPFENVHIYNMLCSILGATPAPNDGDPLVARQLLAP